MLKNSHEDDHPIPKKAFGRVLGDDRPIDDYENTVRQDEAQRRAPSPPNRAVARRGNAAYGPHESGIKKAGTTSSKYRGVSKH
ncbi:hypothetical protein BGW36DRAFT_289641 [Talaromyces proteolyticus]|uniref:Uncharacterized protein n=1 Tax=Talaromyces proteolyticus TaxID=1131652 RepID=A0AAD4KXS3_9EURO|nr:uncharacterized protein BGW36DRAFT_289641 [Talaromyces proteolyticus]KAH8701763.1 hypothetical protein BGW36DRAFT_289641 [Talaromyces proteolyticus]